MKLRLAPLALLPILAAAAPASQTRPDLVITGVTSPHLDQGVVTVQVKNQGGTTAGASHLAVQLSGLATGTTTVQVGAIAAGATVSVDVPTGKLLSQVSYRAIADRSNEVRESNERNNTLSGQFGGKP